RPEGFAIDRGTESGLGDIAFLGKFVLFHTTAGEHRSLSFDDPKNPHFEKQDSDFTASALLIGGVKFPTGGTKRLKEEFSEVAVPGAPRAAFMATISLSAPPLTTPSSADRLLFVTNRSSSRPTLNLPC